MGENIYGQKRQLDFLHGKMEILMTVLDSIEPEEVGVEEVDQIIAMLDEIEGKCKKFRNSTIVNDQIEE